MNQLVTNIYTKCNQLPPLKEVVVGGKTYTDDEDRMNFIKGIARKVKDRIAGAKR